MSEEASNDAADIFGSALQITAPGEREAFLEHACHEQATLRAQVDDLLASQPAAEQFFLEAESVCRKLLDLQ